MSFLGTLAPSRLALACGLVLAAPGAAHAVDGGLGILGQAAGLPREFAEHFFEVPLAVRVDLDGRLLGEAMVVLTRDEHIQLLEFTDISDSQVPASVRLLWKGYLQNVRPLGPCVGDCASDLVALHYSLRNSQLSILTRGVERDSAAERFVRQPEAGSGLILRNQLNLSAAAGETVGRYALSGQGTLGQWTTQAQAQLDRSVESEQGTRHRVDQLYAERLRDDRFFRLGYFTPSVQGLTRQPKLLGDQPDTTLGVMIGSSDSLVINNPSASTTPVYVTPERPAVAEIYRNGTLINSQPVQPGLQSLDTTVLPGGIYEVQIRLIEDGRLAASSEAFIYKPTNWREADEPWRYNLYAGRQSGLLTNWQDEHNGVLSAGLIGNYLLHPRAVLGLSAQRVDARMQYGSSLDWDALDRLKLYGNLFKTQNQGNGYDLQALYNYPGGNLVLSHSRTWQYVLRDQYRYLDDPLRQRELYRSREGESVRQSALSWHHRLTARSSATVRLSHTDGASAGTSVDLGLQQRGRLLGSDVDWRWSVFDRPASFHATEARSRGVNVSLSLNLGEPGRRFSATLGSRTGRDGGHDRNGSVTYQQDVDYGALRSVAGTLSVDRYGVGTGANGQFQNAWSNGDAYALSSSYNGELSAGLNLESTVAVGQGAMTVSGEYQRYEAGLIVDVESDIQGLQLHADDVLGQGGILHAGRNILAVRPWQAGNVQLDFSGRDAHAAVIQPPILSYHLNRGGVQHRTVKVMRTVTVLGRLVDGSGRPLAGATVINHASRSVSEADGHFSVEMSQSTPVLEVRHRGKRLCLLNVDDRQARRENDLMLVGDRACVQEDVAQSASAISGET